MRDEVRLGIYRHYKGPLYQVLGLAHDANADTFANWVEEPMFPDGRTVVVYVALQLDGAHFGPRMAVRTLDDFMDWADIDEAQWRTIEADNAKRQRGFCPGIGLGSRGDQPVARRFTYLGPVLAPDMLDKP